MSELKTTNTESLEQQFSSIENMQEELTHEAIEQIFSRRAAQLAKTPETESENDQISLALFWLGQEIYAVEAQYVIEIRPAKQLTRVPRVPNWIAGVVNLRGRILSVMKLDAFFGISGVSQITRRGPMKSVLVTPFNARFSFRKFHVCYMTQGSSANA